MEQIIYGITIVIYSVFIIRFILSWVGGDFDLDMDSDMDLDLGDIVSFKGATHFLMGFFGWLSTANLVNHTILWYDYLIAFGIGIVFVIILFYLYKFMLKLECKPNILKEKQLIGQSAKIYLHCGKDGELYKYIIVTNNGTGTVELPARSYHHYNIDDMTTITDYEGAYYIIL